MRHRTLAALSVGFQRHYVASVQVVVSLPNPVKSTLSSRHTFMIRKALP